ncbi:hypothetical protein ACFE04_014271 [Oxalis oulophora]
MVLALVVFLLGTKTYRSKTKGGVESPLVRIGQVFFAAIKNRRTTSIAIAFEEEARGPDQVSEQFKFLDKAVLPLNDAMEYGKVCSAGDVEEAKQLLRLVPIWTTGLVNAAVFSQIFTFFTKQGVTLDREITPSFHLPPAILKSTTVIAIIIFIPIYDPLVEMKTLKTAEEHGLIDLPNVTIPMSTGWMVSQYFLFGVANVFYAVGQQEFFYGQVPNELRSVGLSLYLSILGVGSFLSSFLVSSIDNITSGNDGHGWFSDNLNRAHLDYFYLLLSVLGAIGFATHVYFAKSYVYSSLGK